MRGQSRDAGNAKRRGAEARGREVGRLSPGRFAGRTEMREDSERPVEREGERQSRKLAGSGERKIFDVRRTSPADRQAFAAACAARGLPAVETLQSVNLRAAFQRLYRSDASSFFSFLVNQLEGASPHAPPIAGPFSQAHVDRGAPSESSRDASLHPRTAVAALSCLATYAHLDQCEVRLVHVPSPLSPLAPGAQVERDAATSAGPEAGNVASSGNGKNRAQEERKPAGEVGTAVEAAEGAGASWENKGRNEVGREGGEAEGSEEGTPEREGLWPGRDRGDQETTQALPALETRTDATEADRVERGREDFFFQLTGSGPPCTRGTKERLSLQLIERLMEIAGSNLKSLQASDLTSLLFALVSLSRSLSFPPSSLPFSPFSAPLASAAFGAFPPNPPARLLRFSRRIRSLLVRLLARLAAVAADLDSHELLRSSLLLLAPLARVSPSAPRPWWAHAGAVEMPAVGLGKPGRQRWGSGLSPKPGRLGPFAPGGDTGRAKGPARRSRMHEVVFFPGFSRDDSSLSRDAGGHPAPASFVGDSPQRRDGDSSSPAGAPTLSDVGTPSRQPGNSPGAAAPEIESLILLLQQTFPSSTSPDVFTASATYLAEALDIAACRFEGASHAAFGLASPSVSVCHGQAQRSGAASLSRGSSRSAPQETLREAGFVEREQDSQEREEVREARAEAALEVRGTEASGRKDEWGKEEDDRGVSGLSQAALGVTGRGWNGEEEAGERRKEAGEERRVWREDVGEDSESRVELIQSKVTQASDADLAHAARRLLEAWDAWLPLLQAVGDSPDLAASSPASLSRLVNIALHHQRLLLLVLSEERRRREGELAETHAPLGDSSRSEEIPESLVGSREHNEDRESDGNKENEEDEGDSEANPGKRSTATLRVSAPPLGQEPETPSGEKDFACASPSSASSTSAAPPQLAASVALWRLCESQTMKSLSFLLLLIARMDRRRTQALSHFAALRDAAEAFFYGPWQERGDGERDGQRPLERAGRWGVFPAHGNSHAVASRLLRAVGPPQKATRDRWGLSVPEGARRESGVARREREVRESDLDESDLDESEVKHLWLLFSAVDTASAAADSRDVQRENTLLYRTALAGSTRRHKAPGRSDADHSEAAAESGASEGRLEEAVRKAELFCFMASLNEGGKRNLALQRLETELLELVFSASPSSRLSLRPRDEPSRPTQAASASALEGGDPNPPAGAFSFSLLQRLLVSADRVDSPQLLLLVLGEMTARLQAAAAAGHDAEGDAAARDRREDERNDDARKAGGTEGRGGAGSAARGAGRGDHLRDEKGKGESGNKHAQLIGKALTFLFRWMGGAQRNGALAALRDTRKDGEGEDALLPAGKDPTEKGSPLRQRRLLVEAEKDVPLSFPEGRKLPSSLEETRALRALSDNAILDFALAATHWATQTKFAGFSPTDLALLTHALVPLWRAMPLATAGGPSGAHAVSPRPLAARSGPDRLTEEEAESACQGGGGRKRGTAGREAGGAREDARGSGQRARAEELIEVGETAVGGRTTQWSGSSLHGCGARSRAAQMREDFAFSDQEQRGEFRGREWARCVYPQAPVPHAMFQPLIFVCAQGYFAALTEVTCSHLPGLRSLALSTGCSPSRPSSPTLSLLAWKPPLLCLLLHCLIRMTPQLTPSPGRTSASCEPSVSAVSSALSTSPPGPATTAAGRGLDAWEGLCESHRRLLSSSSRSASFAASFAPSPLPASSGNASSLSADSLVATSPWACVLLPAVAEALSALVLFPRSVVHAAEASASALKALEGIMRNGSPDLQASETDASCAEPGKGPSVEAALAMRNGRENAGEGADSELRTKAHFHSAHERKKEPAQAAGGREATWSSVSGAASSVSPSSAPQAGGGLHSETESGPDLSFQAGTPGARGASERGTDRDTIGTAPGGEVAPLPVASNNGDAVPCFLCSLRKASASASFGGAASSPDRLLDDAVTATRLPLSLSSSLFSLSLLPYLADRLASQLAAKNLSRPVRARLAELLKSSSFPFSRPKLFISRLEFRELGSVLWGLDKVCVHNMRDAQIRGAALARPAEGLANQEGARTGRASEILPSRDFTSPHTASPAPASAASFLWGNVHGTLWEGGGEKERVAREQEMADRQHTQARERHFLPWGATLALDTLRRPGGFCHKLALYFSASLRYEERRLLLAYAASPLSQVRPSPRGGAKTGAEETHGDRRDSCQEEGQEEGNVVVEDSVDALANYLVAERRRPTGGAFIRFVRWREGDEGQGGATPRRGDGEEAALKGLTAEERTEGREDGGGLGPSGAQRRQSEQGEAEDGQATAGDGRDTGVLTPQLQKAEDGVKGDSSFQIGKDEREEKRLRKRYEDVVFCRPFRGVIEARDLPLSDSWLSPPGVTLSLLVNSHVTHLTCGLVDLVAATVECPLHLLDLEPVQLQHTLQPIALLVKPHGKKSPPYVASVSAASRPAASPVASAVSAGSPPWTVVPTAAFLRAATLALLRQSEKLLSSFTSLFPREPAGARGGVRAPGSRTEGEDEADGDEKETDAQGVLHSPLVKRLSLQFSSLLYSARALAVLLDAHCSYWARKGDAQKKAEKKPEGEGQRADAEQEQGTAELEGERGGPRGPKPGSKVSPPSPSLPRFDVFTVFPQSFERELQAFLSLLSSLLVTPPLMASVSSSLALLTACAEVWGTLGQRVALQPKTREALQALAPSAVRFLLDHGEGDDATEGRDRRRETHRKVRSRGASVRGSGDDAGGDVRHSKRRREAVEAFGRRVRAGEGGCSEREAEGREEEDAAYSADEARRRGGGWGRAVPSWAEAKDKHGFALQGTHGRLHGGPLRGDTAGTFYRGAVNMKKKVEARDREEASLQHLSAALQSLREVTSLSSDLPKK
ncbi:conserved hypothetical protein [Neospora caninum Liverpool]|uniref:Uncharacterized protein n=1 Tax=Neospora caninum (strain Liverpool) TaxID=572307 RepID=F0VNF8_NEOCL|nr:conserved hypothetical protein [Neospora caninum Liverpool]CBZ55254.1 conserved hypothetical protein [Neospora caninum Liverpool]|eukprot:XP_003885282.1 conserved hypothetical protein [Neospora caninum Liverpool]